MEPSTKSTVPWSPLEPSKSVRSSHIPRSRIKNEADSSLDTGANASAEEAEEGVEDGAIQVNNVVNSFRLNSTQFDKKSYLSHLKCTLHLYNWLRGDLVCSWKC